MNSPKRVLLLGWDAADWQIARPLVEAGRMPNLSRLIESGASGSLATLQPIISPILWNSVATGKRADKHQVLGFVEPMPDGTGLRPVTSTSRKAKAIWNILSQQGRPSVVVDWYASHPAEQIRGAVVTNHYRDSVLGPNPIPAPAVHPADLMPALEKLRVLPSDLHGRQVAPFFLEKQPSEDDPRIQGFAALLAQNSTVHNAATYLAEAEEWDFLAVYYDFIDHACHGFIEYRAPKMAHVSDDDFTMFHQLVDRVYEYHDLMLGRWLELVGDDTVVMIVSDHGFHSGSARPLEPAWLPRAAEGPRGINRNPLVWHRSHGLLVAHGPGIRRDQIVHGATLLDLAPTILTLLGVPVAKDMDGHVLTTMFTEQLNSGTVDSYELPHPADGVWRDTPPEETDPWAAQEALRQLTELGYVEASKSGAEAIAKAELTRVGNLAQVYFGSGRPAEALPLLDQLCPEHENANMRARQAMCLLSLGRLEEAGVAIARALELNPEAPVAQLLDAWLLLLRGDADTAHARLANIKADDEYYPFILLQVGTTFLRQLRWREAEEAFRRVLEFDADSAEAHDGLGVALREQGKLEDAIYEHMTAATLQHERAQTHVNLGISLAMHRKFDWAIRAFEVAAELAPAEPFPHRCLARLHFSVKKDREKARFHGAEMLRRRAALREATPRFSTGG